MMDSLNYDFMMLTDSKDNVVKHVSNTRHDILNV